MTYEERIRELEKQKKKLGNQIDKIPYNDQKAGLCGEWTAITNLIDGLKEGYSLRNSELIKAVTDFIWSIPVDDEAGEVIITREELLKKVLELLKGGKG
jgi:hypothetical protein